jgi:DUF971 family protein
MDKEMANVTPQDITVKRNEKKMIITWSDGKKSELSFDILRESCPCAECGDKRKLNHTDSFSQEDIFIPLQDARTYDIENIQPVGNYALNIIWKDGHRFGIYSWEYLRDL